MLIPEAYALDTKSTHLLVEYHGCDPGILNQVTRIEALLRHAAEEAGATVVTSTFHHFSPQGVSGVVVVEESHLSIHTWPELGYAAVDFYTCGDCVPIRGHEYLCEALGAEQAEVMDLARGGPSGQGVRIRRHYIQDHTEHRGRQPLQRQRAS